MPRRLDPQIGEVLKRYGFGPEACWDCHGVWVVYHRALEQIAAKAGIEFDQPFIVEANGAEGIAAVCVTGRLKADHNERVVWSIGEASPKNNKNAYCWAMAEKRALDRVILKLIGLHGLAYSEEEAGDFQPPKQHGNLHGPLKITELKEKMREFATELPAVEDEGQLSGLLHSYKDVLDQCMRDLPQWYYGNGTEEVKGAFGRIEEVREKLQEAERYG